MPPLRAFLLALLVLLSCLPLAGCGSDDDGKDSPKASEPSGDEQATDDDDAAEDDEEELVVIPGKGIAGVLVGDDEATLVQALGEPDSRQEVPNELSGATNERLVWDAPAMAAIVAPIPPLDGEPARTEVTQLETTDDRVRTANGLGRGDSQEDVEAAYPEIECDTGTIHVCRLGRQEAGSVVTDFFIQDGVVSRVVVGRIID